MTVKRRYLWLYAVAMLVVLAGRPALGAEAPTMIVPGQSLGPVTLGMSLDEVTAVLGRPVPGADGTLVYPSWKISVTFDDGLAVRISTTDPQFRTRRGAGIGTSPEVATQLVGDFNEIYAIKGSDLTAVYPFVGVGFVFRDGRAVEVFVVRPVVLPSQAATLRPMGPGTPAASPSPPPSTETPPQGVPLPGATLQVWGLTETVDVGRSRLQVSGQVLNTGSQPVGPVTITATFLTAEKEEIRAQAVVQDPITPKGEAPFTLEASLAHSVVVRYTVEVSVTGPGGTSTPVHVQQTVPVAIYADLAQQRIQVSAQLGGPSNTGPMVQVLVSISGTGPIPPAWVREVLVVVPYTGGSRTVTLAPGQTQTILIPSVAQVGSPQVQGVTLSAP